MKREINEDTLNQCRDIKIDCRDIKIDCRDINNCKRKKFCHDTRKISHDRG